MQHLTFESTGHRSPKKVPCRTVQSTSQMVQQHGWVKQTHKKSWKKKMTLMFVCLLKWWYPMIKQMMAWWKLIGCGWCSAKIFPCLWPNKLFGHGTKRYFWKFRQKFWKFHGANRPEHHDTPWYTGGIPVASTGYIEAMCGWMNVPPNGIWGWASSQETTYFSHRVET